MRPSNSNLDDVKLAGKDGVESKTRGFSYFNSEQGLISQNNQRFPYFIFINSFGIMSFYQFIDIRENNERFLKTSLVCFDDGLENIDKEKNLINNLDNYNNNNNTIYIDNKMNLFPNANINDFFQNGNSNDPSQQINFNAPQNNNLNNNNNVPNISMIHNVEQMIQKISSETKQAQQNTTNDSSGKIMTRSRAAQLEKEKQEALKNSQQNFDNINRNIIQNIQINSTSNNNIHDNNLKNFPNIKQNPIKKFVFPDDNSNKLPTPSNNYNLHNTNENLILPTTNQQKNHEIFNKPLNNHNKINENPITNRTFNEGYSADIDNSILFNKSSPNVSLNSNKNLFTTGQNTMNFNTAKNLMTANNNNNNEKNISPFNSDGRKLYNENNQAQSTTISNLNSNNSNNFMPQAPMIFNDHLLNYNNRNNNFFNNMTHNNSMLQTNNHTLYNTNFSNNINHNNYYNNFIQPNYYNNFSNSYYLNDTFSDNLMKNRNFVNNFIDNFSLSNPKISNFYNFSSDELEKEKKIVKEFAKLEVNPTKDSIELRFKITIKTMKEFYDIMSNEFEEMHEKKNKLQEIHNKLHGKFKKNQRKFLLNADDLQTEFVDFSLCQCFVNSFERKNQFFDKNVEFSLVNFKIL